MLILKIANTFASMLFGGWVFSWMWMWFLTPIGVRIITAPEGAGIVLMVGVLLSRLGPADLQALDSQKTLHEARIAAVIYPWLVWMIFGFLAWVWQALMIN